MCTSAMFTSFSFNSLSTNNRRWLNSLHLWVSSKWNWIRNSNSFLDCFTAVIEVLTSRRILSWEMGKKNSITTQENNWMKSKWNLWVWGSRIESLLSFQYEWQDLMPNISNCAFVKQDHDSLSFFLLLFQESQITVGSGWITFANIGTGNLDQTTTYGVDDRSANKTSLLKTLQ